LQPQAALGGPFSKLPPSLALDAIRVPLNDLPAVRLVESYLQFAAKPLFHELVSGILFDQQVHLSALLVLDLHWLTCMFLQRRPHFRG